MKNRFTLFVGLLVVIVLLSYAFMFQVRYDEVAVLTTFQKAGDNSIKNEPNLYFRLPWPFQNVTKYSTRLHLLEDQLEQLQTADGQNVIVRTFTTWRITDPLKFFQKLSTEDAAEDALLPIVRDTREIITKFRFDELVNIDANKMKLPEIEQAALTQLQEQLAAHDYGITVDSYGIRKIVLPQTVTEKVFQQMRETRQRLAANTRASGEAEAAAIKAEARSIQQRIMAFAQRRAQSIRAQGDEEAAEYYEVFQQDEQFAIFLRQVEALKAMLAHNTTFVLDAKQLSPLDLFTTPPAKLVDRQPTPPAEAQ